MPRVESSKAAARTQASRRPIKKIEKTSDLLRHANRLPAEGSGRDNVNRPGDGLLLSGGTGLAKSKHGSKETVDRKGKGREIVKAASSRALPDSIQVERFAEVRALEILAFQNAVKSAAAQGKARVFQSLPRHLRRRAASHNPKRVPKRLRRKAAQEIAPTDNIAKLHRKRAKLRAKGNLRGESRTEQLLKRQLDKKWLKTHIYHAKRFHMINLWGYRLPLTPTLKSFRPAYRASRRKCIALDVSYFGIIELQGTRDALVRLLGNMTGGAFAGQKYESGQYMAQTTLYHPSQYPQGLIGPVDILWHNEAQRIWLRLHPSIFQETWETIADCKTANVSMLDVRDELAAFELVGPESGRLLRRTLKVCKGGQRLELDDPQSLPHGTIMAFVIHDPRLTFPPRAPPERKAHESRDGVLRAASPSTPSRASAALWDQSTRLAAPKNKKSDLDHRRRKADIPGTRLQPTSLDDRVPILIVASDDRYLLLFPANWSMPILQSIVYSGTLIGGLRERQVQFRESGRPSFPEHFGSVCIAGQQREDDRAEEDQARWRRKPPGKRASDPTFKPDWNRILDLTEEDQMNDSKVWSWPTELKDHVGNLDAIAAFRRARRMPLKEVDTKTCVVMVKLDMSGRGSPGDMATIYLPIEDRIVGCTTSGNYSLTRGTGFALGQISLAAWLELDEGKVRVKNNEGVFRDAIGSLV